MVSMVGLVYTLELLDVTRELKDTHLNYCALKYILLTVVQSYTLLRSICNWSQSVATGHSQLQLVTVSCILDVTVQPGIANKVDMSWWNWNWWNYNPNCPVTSRSLWGCRVVCNGRLYQMPSRNPSTSCQSCHPRLTCALYCQRHLTEPTSMTDHS